MPKAIEAGDSCNELELAVLRTHRLKSGVPAGCLARMGAVLGGATTDQKREISRYFEALGVSFQIVDDVLSIKGFEGQQKATLGEDISTGKITYPIARAMRPENLDKKQRQELWRIVKMKTSDTNLIRKAIKLIEECGALEQSLEKAKKVLNDAWVAIDPIIEESYYKIMLRAFGNFVLDRHY
mmetsp:Transcript_8600/g.13925  ORF Transcript_8600/g.13925 Transcript_8600/m.13925 type:complete len:183 (-) Transcript_8600:178-726(-)